MSDPAAFSKLVPGFDFLQTLVKNAGSAMPAMGQWVAPTLDPAELEKRINELRTVQFWLEQNARMLGVTIQALEVQRMTLSTLQTMNVQMGDLRDAMTLRVPDAKSPAPAASAPKPAAAASPATSSPPGAAAASGPAAAGAAAAAPSAGVVDPMQWWNALTRQFTELAVGAMKDGVAVAGVDPAMAAARSAADAAAGGAPADPAAQDDSAASAEPAAGKAAGLGRRKPAAQ